MPDFGSRSGNIDNSLKIEVSFDSNTLWKTPTTNTILLVGGIRVLAVGALFIKMPELENTPNDINLHAYWLGTSNLKYELTSSNSAIQFPANGKYKWHGTYTRILSRKACNKSRRLCILFIAPV